MPPRPARPKPPRSSPWAAGAQPSHADEISRRDARAPSACVAHLRLRSSRPAGPARLSHHRVHQCHNESQHTSPPDFPVAVAVTNPIVRRRPSVGTATSGTERGGKQCSPVMRGSVVPAAVSVPTSEKPKPITSCRSARAARGTTRRTASVSALRAMDARREASRWASHERHQLKHQRQPRRRGPSTDRPGACASLCLLCRKRHW